jgi:hypothetical protein
MVQGEGSVNFGRRRQRGPGSSLEGTLQLPSRTYVRSEISK